MVQADISHYDRLRAEVGTFQAVRTIVDAHFALSAEALRRADLDFLVWPETVYPTTFGAPKSEDGAAFDRAVEGRRIHERSAGRLCRGVRAVLAPILDYGCV